MGNPVTDGNFDSPAKIPFAHGMGLISDEMYKVNQVQWVTKMCNPNPNFTLNVGYFQAYKDSCSAQQNSQQSFQCTNSLDVIDKVLQMFLFFILMFVITV